jgi:hypothetical protein
LGEFLRFIGIQALVVLLGGVFTSQLARAQKGVAKDAAKMHLLSENSSGEVVKAPSKSHIFLSDEARVCSRESGPEIHSCTSLASLESQYDALVEGLEAAVKERDDISDAEYSEMIEKIVNHGELLQQVTLLESDWGIRGYFQAEAARLYAELLMKLSVAQPTNNKQRDSLLLRAQKEIEQGWNDMKMQTGAVRSQDYPALLGSLTQSRLALMHLEHLAHPKELSEADFSKKVLKHFEEARSLSARPIEKADIDLLEAEALIALTEKNIGGTQPHSDRKLEKRLSEILKDLPLRRDDLRYQQEPAMFVDVLHERTKAFDVVGSFYTQGPKGVNRGLEKLDAIWAAAKTPEDQEMVLHSVDFLLKDMRGTYAGHETLNWAKTNLTAVPRFDLPKMIAEDQQLEAEYNSGVQEKFGEEFSKLFQLPTYRELTSSSGRVLSVYETFSSSIAKYAKRELEMKELKTTPNDEQIEEMRGLAESADLAWVYLQCQRRARQPFRARMDLVTTPLGFFKVNLSRCHGAGESAAPKVAATLIQEKASAGRLGETAWLVGNFGLDTATVIASGGLIYIVKKGFQKAAVRGAGKVAFEVGVSRAGAKAAMKTAKVVGGIVAVDVTSQTVGGTRNYIQSGLQEGDWDFKNFKKATVYFDENSWTGAGISKHFLRMAAVGYAGKFSTMLLKRGGNNPYFKRLGEKAEKSSVNSLGVAIVQGGVSQTLSQTASRMADLPFETDKKKKLKETTDKLLSLENWASFAKNTVVGKSGKFVSSKFGANFSERMATMKTGSMADPVRLQRLVSCFGKPGR